MADGVFTTPNVGDTIQQALLLRYQHAQTQAAMAQAADMAGLKAREGLLSRMTLTGPGNSPANYTDYLGAMYGHPTPGMTAVPTPAFSAGIRADAQSNIADSKNDQQTKTLGVKMRQQWASQLEPGKSQPASYFAPEEVLTQYGIDPKEVIGSAQKKPSGGGGKSPEQTRLDALKATATSLYKQLGVASKEDAARLFSSVRSLSPEQQHIKGQLADIDTETAKLGGLKPGKGSTSEFDALYKQAGLK